MLDVLVPALEVLKNHQAGPDLYARLIESAATSEAQTIDMIALKGRASYLGERSVGHMDPGARTCGLAIRVICGNLGDTENG